MRGRFIILAMALLIGACQSAFARQLFVLRGFVFSTESGDPISNANVVITGTKSGTSSDSDGYFEFRLPAGNHSIRITSVGFAKREISVDVSADNRETLKIGLKPEKFEIEGIDVYAMRYIADRDTAINRVPLSLLPAVTRVSAIEIEKQGAVTLVDALKFVPGGWTENRGRKTKQFFSVRGQKYPYPDYSIDGVWQKEFEETGYFLSALDIESVEIVRSGNALVKGLSGLTGVVDIKTRKPERETVSLTTKYGEMNNYLANLQYGNKIKEVTFTASTAFFGTNGPEGRNGKERIGNFHGNLNWEASPRFTLMAGATYINGLRQLINIEEPGAANIISRQEEFDPIRTLLSYVKFIYKGAEGSTTELQTNLSHRNAGFSSYNIPQKTTTTYDEKDWEYGFNLLHSRSLSPSNTLRIGALYNHWEAPEGKRYYIGRSCDVHTYSGVVATEQKLGKLFLDAGVRIIGGYINEWGGFGIEGSATGFQNVAPVENEAAPFEWQSVLGATYILSTSASLHYNFAGGTIAPRKGALNKEGDTPENEGRMQHDLGFRIETDNNGEFSGSAFYTRRNNAIDFSGQTVTTDNGLVMELYENLDRRSYGVELSAKRRVPVLHSTLFANAMIMKGKKETVDGMSDDNQLPNLILNAGAYFEYSGFDANFFVNYTGPYTNNRFVNPNWVKTNGDFPLGDFISADLTAGYTFKGKVTKRIFAEVKNVLDKKYMTVAGYPEPGRIFMGGIKIQL